MITFKELYEQVENSSHETAFNRKECLALWKFSKRLKKDSVAVEIGIEFGRSTTVIGQAAKEIGFVFYAVDSWVDVYSKEAKKHVEDYQIKELGLPIIIKSMTSEEAASKFPHVGIDLLHIDGDPSFEGVSKDIKNWLPKVKKGGVVLFDDYGHESLEGVWKATKKIRKSKDWKSLGTFGNKLGVFLRLR